MMSTTVTQTFVQLEQDGEKFSGSSSTPQQPLSGLVRPSVWDIPGTVSEEGQCPCCCKFQFPMHLQLQGRAARCDDQTAAFTFSVYFSHSGGWEFQAHGADRFSLVRAHILVHGYPLSIGSSHSRRVRDVSGVVLYKYTNSIHKGSTLFPNHLPKASPLNTITLAIRIATYGLGGRGGDISIQIIAPDLLPVRAQLARYTFQILT